MQFPWAAALAAVGLLLNLGCNRTPALVENDEQLNQQARSASLVVVGVIDSDRSVGSPRPSRADPRCPMQLHRTRVRVENVLRGSIKTGTFVVYYFGFAGGFDGPRPMGFWNIPSRRVLWMRRDGGVLRMACDGWDGCTMPVESGAHPQYRADPDKPLDYALADVLLTRGDGAVSDDRFADEISSGVPDPGLQSYVMGKLEQLARTEPAIIKAAACEQLRIDTRDRIEGRLQQQARQFLKAASCEIPADRR